MKSQKVSNMHLHLFKIAKQYPKSVGKIDLSPAMNIDKMYLDIVFELQVITPLNTYF